MATKFLHTIGYEGSSIDDFLSTLKVAGIELLIDVREVAISRKKGFSKTAFAERLVSHGIEYLHLRGLGDPKAGRMAARDGRHQDFKKIFRTHLITHAAQDDLARGIEAASEKIACLLCFERDHKYCHRAIVADEMAGLGDF